MRILPGGTDHELRRAAGTDAESNRRADRLGDERQHLPLWHLRAYQGRSEAGGVDGRIAMRSRRQVLDDAKHGIIEDPIESRTRRRGRETRRTFIAVSVAATGGLLVALRSEAAQTPAAAGPVPFPTHYIQVDPDDRVLIWSA